MNPEDDLRLRLAPGDIVEVDAYRPVPFRAGVEPDASAAAKMLAIDEKGLGMWQIAAGETFEVRLSRSLYADPRSGVLRS